MTLPGRGNRRLAWLALALGAAAAPPAALALRAVHLAWSDLHPGRHLPSALQAHPELSGAEEVAFTAEDGILLHGWWVAPRNGGAVVLTHGWGENREQMLPQALMLARRGFGVLVYDLRAHGASEGRLCTSGDQERRDVRAAVAFTATRPAVRPGAVGAVGFSIGALATAEVALEDRRVAAVALEAMHTSLDELLEHDYGAYGRLSALPARWAYRALGVRPGEVRAGERICALAPRPLLLVYGERDREVQAGVGRALAARACGPVQLWVVPGGGHGRWEERWAGELDARLAALFERALAPAATRPEEGR